MLWLITSGHYIKSVDYDMMLANGLSSELGRYYLSLAKEVTKEAPVCHKFNIMSMLLACK